VDAFLVLAVLSVLIVWWQIDGRPPQETVEAAENRAILPTDVPLLSPTSTATPPPPPTETPVPVAPVQTLITHEVQSGETLLSISGLYGITVEEIQQANNLSSELIRVGDKLTIPVLRKPDAPVNAAPAVTSRFEYTVRENDTIISIALTFGSTVDDILTANNLAANAIIRPGDKLFIPVVQVPQAVIDSTNIVTPTGSSSLSSAPSSPTIIYIEPRLIGPPDNVTLPRGEPVLLRWVSVDVLRPNEWYVLLIYPSGDAAQPIPSIWTKSTSYRLGSELAPSSGQSATYTWRVSVVRVNTSSTGAIALEAASPPSAIRRFTWQ
jgi:LysM repeat protein